MCILSMGGNLSTLKCTAVVWPMYITVLVDALCRDEQGQISRDPRTKRLLTQRQRLAKPSKHASNSAFAHI